MDGELLVIVGKVERFEVAVNGIGDGCGVGIVSEPCACELGFLRHNDIAHPKALAQQIGHCRYYFAVFFPYLCFPVFTNRDGIHPPRLQEDGDIRLLCKPLCVFLFLRHGLNF